MSVQNAHRCPGPMCAYVDEHQADELPAPRVAGAIARGLADDLASKHRQQLDELWRDLMAALPDD